MSALAAAPVVLASWRAGLADFRLVGRGSGFDLEYLNTDSGRWTTLTGDDRRFQVVAQELARHLRVLRDRRGDDAAPLPGTDEFLAEEHA